MAKFNETKIIAAYPCLGKTTIAKTNIYKFFDREFNESRSTSNMTAAEKNRFFDLCANMIELQYLSKTHNVIFITEDDNILRRLIAKNIPFSVVFPDIFKGEYVINEYRQRVLRRSGAEWWNRVIAPDFENLKDGIRFYQENDLAEVYLTDCGEYISDVVSF